MKEILYDWGGVNVWLFHLINDLRGSALDSLMLLGTRVGDHSNYPVYFALAAFIGLTAFTCRPKSRHPELQAQATGWLMALAVLSIAYLADGALIGWLKPLLDFPRPPLALPAGTVHVVGALELHHSLPSGHSAFAMLIAASLWPVLNRNWRVVVAAFVLWVGISRISLGAHFPADVMAGFLLSLIVVILVRGIIAFLLRIAARIS